MGLKDDLDESSFSASSDIGMDNVGLNIDKYLDEIERTLHDKSSRSVPSSSHGYSGSTIESKIFASTTSGSSIDRGVARGVGGGLVVGGGGTRGTGVHVADGSTYHKYSPDPRPSTSGTNVPSSSSSSHNHHNHRHHPHHDRNHHAYVTSITVEPDSGFLHHEPMHDNLESSGGLQLIWRNLMYLSKPGSIWSGSSRSMRKSILEKQSGSISGGQITAIIGPSGAGKSTLLECLAGRRKTGLKGEVYIKYEKMNRESKSDIKISLIGQKDDALSVLTVNEVLTFASRIKNYDKISNSYFTPRLVSSVLDELNLQKCADTKVAKISGGQLKRLVFGVELISGPDIILLDEPTSGLDASSAYSCVKLLKKLTDLKRNIYHSNHHTNPLSSSGSGIGKGHSRFKSPAIMCSIHQPSARVMHNFHKIYVLSSDGRCIFQGPPGQLLPHLSQLGLACPTFHNPADFIIEIASGDYGLEPVNKLAIMETDRQIGELNEDKIMNHHQQQRIPGGGSIVYTKVSRVVKRMKNRNFPIFLHTYLLWKRTLVTNIREPKLTWLRMVQAVFIALIMSFLYDYPIGEPDGCYPRADAQAVDFSTFRSPEDNIAFVFFITLFTVMASMMPTVLTFPSEVAILLQERNNGWYSCATYYVAKIIAEFPLQVIITLTFIAIIYPMTGQVMEWHRFGYFSLICLLISSIAQCVGILFGTYYVRSVENAVFLAPLSMAPVFLLSGFFGKLSSIPLVLKPFAYISYVRYAFEALLIILYGFKRCSPGQQANSLNSSSSETSSESNNVPSHLLNTGFVSKNEIEYANRRLRKNFSRIPSYRFNPINSADLWQETTTTTPSPAFGNQHSPIFQNPPTNHPFNTYNHFGPNSPSPANMNNNNNQTLAGGSWAGSGSSDASPSLFASEESYVLKRFDVTEDSFYINLIILISFLLILRILCYIILLKKTNQRK